MNTSKNAHGLRPNSDQLFSGFSSLDVGSPQLSGSAERADTGWNISAGGTDVWEKSDQFHFVYKEISGDFDIAVRVQNFMPADLYSKAGLMARETLEAGSRHLFFVVFSDNEPRNNNLGAYELQFRSVSGGDSQAIYPAVRPPAPPEFPAAYPNSWLRVQRQGERFTAHVSTDGKNWKVYATHALTLASTLKVGPALTSHNSEIPARAEFRDYTESIFYQITVDR